MNFLRSLSGTLRPDPNADRVVPPSGFTARLTIFAAAAMAFLAVFAMALALASNRLATSWDAELANSSTVRLTAPAEETAAQTDLIMRILESTAGVAFARALTPDEQQELLAPWFGDGFDLGALPVPQLIEVIHEDEGFDAESVRLRLAAEVPNAVLETHDAWRAPLVAAANRLRALGWVCALLLGLSTAAMVTLAAQSSLAANAQVISVLRLVGATDHFIARAFVRRFTLRALGGAAVGTALGMVIVWSLPGAADRAGFLMGAGFAGAEWLLPLPIPLLAGMTAFAATRWAAYRVLGGLG